MISILEFDLLGATAVPVDKFVCVCVSVFVCVFVSMCLHIYTYVCIRECLCY